MTFNYHCLDLSVDTVSLCSPGCLRIDPAVQAHLEITAILLSLRPSAGIAGKSPSTACLLYFNLENLFLCV